MITELWSIEYTEIEAYILSIGGIKLAEGKYKYKDTTISVTKEKDKKLGPLSFPQNLIKLDGDINDATDFQKSFRLKYLKAGG